MQTHIKSLAKEPLVWKCHTPRLFDEILTNPGTSTLRIPLRIFRSMLVSVAQRAIELNDDKLNLLMLRLTLYSCADPLSKDYNPHIINQLEKKLTKPPTKGTPLCKRT